MRGSLRTGRDEHTRGEVAVPMSSAVWGNHLSGAYLKIVLSFQGRFDGSVTRPMNKMAPAALSRIT